jgi:hypothetical protein
MHITRLRFTVDLYMSLSSMSYDDSTTKRSITYRLNRSSLFMCFNSFGEFYRLFCVHFNGKFSFDYNFIVNMKSIMQHIDRLFIVCLKKNKRRQSRSLTYPSRFQSSSDLFRRQIRCTRYFRYCFT